METKTLLERAVSLYDIEGSIKAVARQLNITETKARKLLITAGVDIKSQTLDKIQKLMEQGLNIQEVADRLEVTPGYINSYLPYTKVIYNLKNPTFNAKGIRKLRERRENKY